MKFIQNFDRKHIDLLDSYKIWVHGI